MISTTALDFYNRNKNCTWKPQAIPEHFTNDIDRARWILNESNFGWIELDINIDLGGWQIEAHQAEPYFVEHREDESQGWSSCCIHGIAVEKTGAWTNYGYEVETDVPYAWTELSYKSSQVSQFWKNQFPSERYRRIRFMKLDPNSAITPHSDMPGRLPGEENFDALDFGVPVNIAVIHPKDCHMILENYGVVPFKEGRAFIINIRNYHSVLNFSNQPRVHVIGHSFGYGSRLKEFATLVVNSYKKQCNHI